MVTGYVHCASNLRPARKPRASVAHLSLVVDFRRLNHGVHSAARQRARPLNPPNQPPPARTWLEGPAFRPLVPALLEPAPFTSLVPQAFAHAAALAAALSLAAAALSRVHSNRTVIAPAVQFAHRSRRAAHHCLARAAADLCAPRAVASRQAHARTSLS